MNARLDQFFANLRAEERCAFVPFLMLGDPDENATVALATTLVAAGADMLELGLPFSDPAADGPTVQAAAVRALAAGMDTQRAIALVARLHQAVDVPLSLLCYANPLEQYGLQAALDGFAGAGLNAILIADVPLEEVDRYAEAIGRARLGLVLLASAVSSDERLRAVGARADGFIYAAARVGVTGAQTQVDPLLAAQLARIRRWTGRPVVAGFGLSTPAHMAAVAATGVAGAICGSAIVRQVAELPTHGPAVHAKLGEFVQSCVAAMHKQER